MAPEEDREEGTSGDDEETLTPREFVIELARDVILAVAIVGIAIGSIFAYSGVWPPMVVVESGSMQHSSSASYLGVIDTGDLVLVQAVDSDPGLVTTYVQGRATGYDTYSNYGDVIVFHPPGAPPSVTPIIHRAIVYVEWPSGTGPGVVDLPSLASFPRSEWSGTYANGSPATTPLGLRTVSISVASWHLGYRSMASLTFDFTLVNRAGFLTKGDHNSGPDSTGPVPVTAIIGKARGELPWFGLIKLTVWPTTGCCPDGWGSTGSQGAPKNSWDSLTTSLILVPLGIFLADYGFAFAERYWKDVRRRKKERTGGKEPPEDLEKESPDDGST